MPNCDKEYRIDVSILPLNEQYTRVSLRGSYLNGQSFNEDEKMTIALKDFESAMLASVKGDSSLYKAYEPKKQRSKKFQFGALWAAHTLSFSLKKLP